MIFGYTKGGTCSDVQKESRTWLFCGVNIIKSIGMNQKQKKATIHLIQLGHNKREDTKKQDVQTMHYSIPDSIAQIPKAPRRTTLFIQWHPGNNSKTIYDN